MKKASHLQKTLDKLHAYTPSSHHIFTLYLENLSHENGEALAQVVRKLIRTSLPKDAQRTCAKEIALVLAYHTTDYDSQHHLSHVALFAGPSFWEIIHHTFSIENTCYISHAPETALLDDVLRQNGRYLFVVADREKANIFTFYKGKLEKYHKVFDPSVPQTVKANKGEYFVRNDIILRHIQDHLRRHFEKIVQEIPLVLKQNSVAGVFVGGHTSLFHALKKSLPKELKEKLAGQFVTELNIPQKQLIIHAEQLLVGYLRSEKGVI
jgi:peptide subunit release factor 1 (eRF1)